ncbi:pectate lyase [Cellulomonas oligotrophica]|uniref:pectate lyase n=1 Tax=Cellulomonas oligotrophica TaxID=931536 RepID=A0A7Y9FIG7_9CELL|nr:pectate lyase [Cellulomonas oligotrophica]NYD87909.1 hypothetical protein [Cellulomonas oligotrophica]GIG32883.1 hypothetical protein Col01nite_20420 [Cellulomonas oligotrophica]
MSTPVARPARFRPSARRLPKPVAVAIAVAFALLTTVAVARVTFAASDPVDTTSWYTITSRKSGLVLQAQGTSAGSGLTQAAATGATSQQFRFATASGGTYRLINRASGLAVTVPSGSTVTQAADTSATNQRWKTLVQSDYVRLATTTGTVLQITGASTKAGAAIQTGTDGKSYHQQWEIKRVGAATGGTTPSATPKPSASASATPKPSASASATAAPAAGSFAKWPTATGQQKVTATIKISGTRDMGMVRYYGLSSGDQTEGQPPMFQLENGAVLKNVILGEGAADGVHCLGTCTLENVWWENVGEDAATFKGTSASQTMTVNGGGARSASDKTFQHNGPGTFVIKNFQLQDFGKLYRSCGNCSKQYARTVKVENVLITAPGKSLVGINSNLGDKATLSGVTIVGDSSKKISICDEYKGVTSGEPSKISSGPSAACGYTASSITYK